MSNKRDENYKERFEEKTGLLMLDDYKGSKQHHKLKCTVCQHEWSATPVSRMTIAVKTNRKGCPNCLVKLANDKFREAGNYIERLNLLGYQVIGTYVNAVTRVDVKCVECGKVRNILPSSTILHQSKCCYRNSHDRKYKDFLNRLDERNKEMPGHEVYFDDDKFTLMSEKYWFRCKNIKHGRFFREATMVVGNRAIGCPLCKSS